MVKRKDSLGDLATRYDWVRQVTDDAITQRSSLSEFHGMEEGLIAMRGALLDAYDKTRTIKHIRDRGEHREEILRHVLINQGLIPKKYKVAKTRMRVVAPSGHVSPELDIVLYDESDTVTLRRFEGTLDYVPIESVHGTIQVKSRLSKKALGEGLENIRKFKSLIPSELLEKAVNGMTFTISVPRRFAILFAYEYDLAWEKIIDEVKIASGTFGAETLPNIIIILDKGHMIFGSKEKYCWKQCDLETLSDVVVHGFPDLSGHSFLEFYSILMELLKGSTTAIPNLSRYMRLPLTAGPYSYSYSYGATAELAVCSTHGSYLKTIDPENIKEIVGYARTAAAINWIKATEIAYGQKGDNQKAYDRQPGDVRIYNPDNLPLPDILVSSDQFLTYDSLCIEGMTIWIPYYYTAKDGLINGCPKCA